MPERDKTRINERIRVPEVRLINEKGEQIGVLKTDAALKYAQERGLDLVEVAADSRPPVCRVLDYSKYKYEQSLKAKQSRKHQQTITIREIKFRPKIAQHDYDTKKGHVERFLRHHDKVKVTIMFRGREREHPERGRDMLLKLAGELQELGTIEQTPLLDGRNMTMVLGPTKAAAKSDDPELAATAADEVPTGKTSRRNRIAAAKAAGIDPATLGLQEHPSDAEEAEADTDAEPASAETVAESSEPADA
jgi:translation initiation factor IF-3